MKHKRKILTLLLLSSLVLLALFLPLEQILLRVQEWADTNPKSAAYAVGAVTVLGIVLLLPSSPLMMLAGFLFGLVKGFFVFWIAGIFASALAFWIGRTVARPWVERKLKNNGTFIAMDRAIERKGFLVVLLTRLVMVLPFPALNYSLGLTSVSFGKYMLGTNLGMALPIFLFVYLGTTAGSVNAIVAGEIQLQDNELLISIAALVATLIIVSLIMRTGLKVLREELANAGGEH